MSGLRLVRRNDTAALTMQEIAEHLRRTDTEEEDVLIERYLKAATLWAENFTGRALVDQTWDYYVDDFPTLTASPIYIPKPPLIEIEEVYYRDSTSSTTALTGYGADLISEPARLYWGSAGTWPSTDGFASAIRIRFRAGYIDYSGSPSQIGDIPEDIRAAIQIYAANLYEQREAVSTGTAMLSVKHAWGAEDLLRMYRVENSMA